MTRLSAVRPFVIDELPSVAPAAPSASLEMARLLARLPHPLTVPIESMGMVEIRPDRVEVGAQVGEGMEELWFELAGDVGCVGVERGAAVQLVSGVCGEASSRLARPLKQSERGVLAALVVSAIATADLPHRPVLRLTQVGGVLDHDARTVGFSICSSFGVHGRGSLRSSPGFFSRINLSRGAWGRSSARLPVSFELARTCLAAEELEAVQLGDGILFSGWHSGEGNAWPVVLRIGDLGLHALFSGDGRIQITTGFFQQRKVRSMNSEDAETLVDLPSAHEILAAAPVTVVAELGRTVVRGDELAGLVPGAVLSLGSGASVELRIEGQPWAKGELVRIGDELAVRITQLRAG